MAQGRPTKYSQHVAALICARLAEGESLRSICSDEEMPASSTVFLWLAKHADFSEQYARAREAQADALFDEIIDIADDSRNDWMEIKYGDSDDEDAGWKVNHEHIQRARLRVDSRKWMASKLSPKKYGDKIQHGGDPDNPLVINVTVGGV